MKQEEKRQVHGYSLAELMIVLAVVGLLVAFSVPSVFTNTSAESGSAAMRLSVFFEEARSMAMGYGEPVRVLIHNDSRQTKGYLRRIIALRRVSENKRPGEDVSDEWEVVLHPMTLPEGIFFDRNRPGVTDQFMTFETFGSREHEWLYYEILPNGSLAGEKRNVVISPGIMVEGMALPRFPNPDLVAGFRISDSSRLILFRDANDIVESFSESES